MKKWILSPADMTDLRNDDVLHSKRRILHEKIDPITSKMLFLLFLSL
jgi:hypothetical protein